MQWDDTPGAGFSEADPGTFHLPLIDSDDFAPSVVNVASQSSDPHSLLAWIKKMLAIRSDHPTFGNGSFDLVALSNPAVLAFRRHGKEQILVAANFSDAAQPVAGLTGSGRDLVAGGTVDLTALRLEPFGFAWVALE